MRSDLMKTFVRSFAAFTFFSTLAISGCAVKTSPAAPASSKTDGGPIPQDDYVVKCNASCDHWTQSSTCAQTLNNQKCKTNCEFTRDMGDGCKTATRALMDCYDKLEWTCAGEASPASADPSACKAEGDAIGTACPL